MGKSDSLPQDRKVFYHRKKISCSLVLKLKVFRSLYFQVLTGALHTVYHESSALFKKIYQVLFNATHQVKAIAIGVVESNPQVEIG